MPKERTQNSAYRRLSKKLEQITRGKEKEVLNYLDVDLDEVSKFSMTIGDLKTPNQRGLGAEEVPKTLKNALIMLN